MTDLSPDTPAPDRPPGAVLVLSENWTIVDPRDLDDLVEVAVEAEQAGVDTVMLSEHVVMGPQRYLQVVGFTFANCMVKDSNDSFINYFHRYPYHITFLFISSRAGHVSLFADDDGPHSFFRNG